MGSVRVASLLSMLPKNHERLSRIVIDRGYPLKWLGLAACVSAPKKTPYQIN